MTEIARPASQNNQFKDVSIYRPPVDIKPQNKNLDDKLNKIAGRSVDSKYVDRSTHNKMDKDSFLKLLTHQLANQDPMKPMDQKEFAADLAQFSQLEQMTNMNTKLESLMGNKGAEGKVFGISFLGKKVLTKGSSINYPGGREEARLPFYLPKKTDHTIVRIFDSKNQTVAQLEPGALGAGGNNVTWDGVSMDGTNANKDTYTFKVYGWNNEGEKFDGETRAEGQVTGVSFEGNETVLEVDNTKKVFLRDVEEIHVPGKFAEQQNNPALSKKALQSYNQISVDN